MPEFRLFVLGHSRRIVISAANLIAIACAGIAQNSQPQSSPMPSSSPDGPQMGKPKWEEVAARTGAATLLFRLLLVFEAKVTAQLEVRNSPGSSHLLQGITFLVGTFLPHGQPFLATEMQHMAKTATAWRELH